MSTIKSRLKNIALRPETYCTLVKIGQKNETFDDIVRRLIENSRRSKVDSYDACQGAATPQQEAQPSKALHGGAG
jgi:predicted CopG family antitoxin